MRNVDKQSWWPKNLKIRPPLGQLSFPSLCQSTSSLRPDQRSFSLTRLVNKNIKGPSRRNEYTNTLSTKRRADGRRDPPSTQWRETRSSLKKNWCRPVENRMNVNDLTITLCEQHRGRDAPGSRSSRVERRREIARDTNCSSSCPAIMVSTFLRLECLTINSAMFYIALFFQEWLEHPVADSFLNHSRF